MRARNYRVWVKPKTSDAKRHVKFYRAIHAHYSSTKRFQNRTYYGECYINGKGKAEAEARRLRKDGYLTRVEKVR